MDIFPVDMLRLWCTGTTLVFENGIVTVHCGRTNLLQSNQLCIYVLRVIVYMRWWCVCWYFVNVSC